MSLVRTVLDIESAFGKSPTGRSVTLSAMTTEEYVRDPEFKLHGIGVKIGNDKPFYVYTPDDVMHFLKTHPWNRSYVIGHHVQFDGAYLSWRAGIIPAFWGCTLSMSRAVFPWEPHTLESLAERLGLPPKGKELSTVKDKWALTDQEQKVLGDYCINDVELTADAFKAMAPKFPPSELRLIDMNTRLYTEPVLVVDRAVLVDEYRRERKAERALLKQCGVDKSILASSKMFAELLLSLGVDPPKKLSPSKVKDGRVNPSKVGPAPKGLLPSFKAMTKKQLLAALGGKVAGLGKEELTALFNKYKAINKEKNRVYPWAYAFGKADEEFKMLEDHPSPHIRDLVAARLNVKSTIKETRSKRFYKIGKRGAFPVYHKYYGAKTGRDSGGDRQNTTNMTRVNKKDPNSGALRRSLNAPDGHLLAVRDLGQIEARKLAYWAGQEDLLDVFRAGGDPYNRQASLIYGYEVDRKLDEFQIEGMAGKAAVLGCFAADTKVLTDSGWKCIVYVKGMDMLWDGEAWVHHSGVIKQGVKECLTAAGVSATPDHEILTGHGWQGWREVLTESSHFQSALNKVTLPSPSGSTKTKVGTRRSVVFAGGREWLTGATSRLRRQLGAILARKKSPQRLEKNIGGTRIFSQTTCIESACSTGLVLALVGATVKHRAGGLTTTLEEESKYTKSGARAQRGAGRSLNILSHLTAGINQSLKLIGSTIKETTLRVTCGLLHAVRTQKTKDQSPICKKRLMTYDIALAGPRSRYTILTDKGPIIVHNCGYQMGWSKFQESLRVGFMGMPSLLFSEEQAVKLGADINNFCMRRSYKKECGTLRDEALQMKPLNVSEVDHLWHCAAVWNIVNKYRKSNGAITALWKEMGNSLSFIAAGQEVVCGARPLVRTCNEGLILPNGMLIQYHKLRKNEGGEWRYLNNRQMNEWAYIYDGKIVENCVQALARIVMTDQMLRIDANLQRWKAQDRSRIYKVVTSTYDEVVTCIPEERAEETMDMMEREMATPPSWCADLPLKSSGGFAKSYGDCEK